MSDLGVDLAQGEKGIRNGTKTGAPATVQPNPVNNSQGKDRSYSRGRQEPRRRDIQAEDGLRSPRSPRHNAKHQRSFGFDNGDRNTSRGNIGSCTDRVAEERRAFGPWQAPHIERQRKLVSRLAPHKEPAAPDPRFDTWVNHFQHYWDIGVDVKSPRPGTRKSERFSSSTTPRNNNAEDSRYRHAGRYTTQYHRLLRRPQTTPGRLGSTDSEGEITMSSGSSGNGGQCPALERQTQSAYTSVHTRGSSDSSNGRVVSGLDRRYMGLQSVTREELGVIVGRLSRMTSAYNAKFAPNPHVWVDTSPGAHWVIKRENTIA